MGLPKKSAKHSVWKRDGYMCRYCGRYLRNEVGTPHSIITVDHVIPRVSGGSNRQENLVTACAPCNFQKGLQENPNNKYVKPI